MSVTQGPFATNVVRQEGRGVAPELRRTSQMHTAAIAAVALLVATGVAVIASLLTNNIALLLCGAATGVTLVPLMPQALRADYDLFEPISFVILYADRKSTRLNSSHS